MGVDRLGFQYYSDRSEPKTLDDFKQTANWGRSVQSIHEEVGTGGDCGMWVWRARTDSWPHHQQLSNTQTTIRSWHLRSWAIDQSMAPTDWVNDLIRWYTKEEEEDDTEHQIWWKIFVPGYIWQIMMQLVTFPWSCWEAGMQAHSWVARDCPSTTPPPSCAPHPPLLPSCPGRRRACKRGDHTSWCGTGWTTPEASWSWQS